MKAPEICDAWCRALGARPSRRWQDRRVRWLTRDRRDIDRGWTHCDLDHLEAYSSRALDLRILVAHTYQYPCTEHAETAARVNLLAWQDRLAVFEHDRKYSWYYPTGTTLRVYVPRDRAETYANMISWPIAWRSHDVLDTAAGHHARAYH